MPTLVGNDQGINSLVGPEMGIVEAETGDLDDGAVTAALEVPGAEIRVGRDGTETAIAAIVILALGALVVFNVAGFQAVISATAGVGR